MNIPLVWMTDNSNTFWQSHQGRASSTVVWLGQISIIGNCVGKHI